MTDPTAVGLGFVAFALLVLAIRYLQVRLTPSARPERVNPTVARDAATTCNAPLCTEPASIRIHAGHGWWHLCIGHGLPLLTEGLRS